MKKMRELSWMKRVQAKVRISTVFEVRVRLKYRFMEGTSYLVLAYATCTILIWNLSKLNTMMNATQTHKL